MKNYYPFRVFDLTIHVDHITRKTIQLFQQYRADAGNARLFAILIKHRHLKKISDGYKTFQVKVL